MKIVLDKDAIMPTRAHSTDAGLDLYSREDKVIPSKGSAIFDTGVHVELPQIEIKMYNNTIIPIYENPVIPTVGFLKSKSGLNVKHNITSDGVIDVGYTGSIIVKLYNHGDEDYQVHKGDKITQLVILPILIPGIEVVDKLEDTERNDDGFGSSGR